MSDFPVRHEPRYFSVAFFGCHSGMQHGSGLQGRAMDMDDCFEMTPQSLKKLCKSLKLYTSCPELNEVIHLHQKLGTREFSGSSMMLVVTKMAFLRGFLRKTLMSLLASNLRRFTGIQKIQNLEEYTGLRTVYLECNAVSKMENLEPLVYLRCLYLNQNLVEVVEGLETLKRLEIIDLADNLITSVAGLACCPELRQLNLSGNKIRTAEHVVHLRECKALQLLDLANNKIDEEDALEVVRSMPLQLLRLCGNPIVSIAQHYRKFTVVAMPTLNYLDESPVFEKERRFAAAFTIGGIEAEKRKREEIKKEEKELREQNRKAFLDLTAENGDRHQNESSASSELANNMYQRLEAEAKARDELELGRSSVGRPTLSDQPVVSDAKKRAASQLDGGGEVEESPPKLLKVICDLEDEMEVEGAVCQAARDLMDLDSADVPVEMPESAFETCDQSSAAEYNALVEENLEEQPSVMTSASLESPKSSENPWLQLAPDEMRECVERERQYKKSLQEKVLQKAASGAQDSMESRQRLLLPCPGSPGEETDTSTPPLHSARPVIWGSTLYRGLWAKASNISDSVEVETDSQSVSTSDAIGGASETMSYGEQAVEHVSMMDVNTCLLMS